jgi:hypothetical protein
LVIVFFGGGFLLLKILELKIELFHEKNFYSLQTFNSDLGALLLTITSFIFIVSIILVIFTNLSVKIRFRKSYLSKSNVYVYDTFLIVLNILIFSIIGFVFFRITDNYYSIFTGMINDGIVDPEANLGILNLFKYLIVIISSLFISLNSFRGITITHKKNEFIFRNHL